ncbi:MAG: prolipoprotein diacylglyceryl transferase [Syntrophomonadaceae bacterium]|nr:prolipoprotein diacylglyceryl transferase [Syntrophomonadaceae bacterium]MDD3890508.1 prolipoprotein diacylglyceryl transferase [Syntrophomonadaceae bacterium]
MRYPTIDFGTFPIYNLMTCLGVILGLLLLIRNIKTYGISEQRKDQLLFLFAIAFLSAAALSNVGNWLIMPELWEQPIPERIRIAGLTYYFGFIGFLGVSSLMLKVFKYEVGKCINYIIPSLLLFHSLGRLGCSFAGCCYGKIVNWNLLGVIDITRFPAREIEAFSLVILFLIVQFYVQNNRMLFYLYTYPIIRFFLEFGRGDYRGEFLFGLLSPAQVISILLITSATIYVGLKKYKFRKCSEE